MAFCVEYRALDQINNSAQIPYDHGWWVTRWTLWSYMFFRIRFTLRIPPNQHEWRGYSQDCLQDSWRPLWVPCHAIWFIYALATFQATMSQLFKLYLRKFLIVFFDDILVYSPTLESHLTHLFKVFDFLSKELFYLKHSKRLFAQEQIISLTHHLF